MLYAIVALLVLIADQALKYYVTLNIPLDTGVVPFIPGFMSLTHYHNTGAAFGMLSGGGARWAFIFLAVVFTAATIYLILNRKLPTRLLNWSLVLVTAGAVGNAIDRFFYGYVVDMFRTDFMEFAIFNVADIAITLGGAALCIAILLMPDGKAGKDMGEQLPEDETDIEKEKTPGIKLFSEKTPLPEDVAESRRTGKLYKEKPVNPSNPFAEFEAMPTKFEKPSKPLVVPDIEKADALAEEISRKQENDAALEAILNEFADGND